MIAKTINKHVDTERLLMKKHQKLIKFLEDWYRTPSQENISKTFLKEVIDELNLLEKFSFTNKNKFYVLFNQIDLSLIYISGNVRGTGYTPQEIYDMTLLDALKRIYWKHVPWVSKVHIDGKAFRDLTKYSSIKNHEFLYCGIKLKDRWGNIKTFLCRQKFLSTNKKEKPVLSFVMAEDITSIYKSDLGWCQAVDYTKEIPLKRVFFFQGNTSAQLLSNRELDILRLIIKNMDSATIANRLKISIETVKKHRKNMIAKVGAKDMTALIYLCQQANVI